MRGITSRFMEHYLCYGDGLHPTFSRLLPWIWLRLCHGRSSRRVSVSIFSVLSVKRRPGARKCMAHATSPGDTKVAGGYFLVFRSGSMIVLGIYHQGKPVNKRSPHCMPKRWIYSMPWRTNVNCLECTGWQQTKPASCWTDLVCS